MRVVNSPQPLAGWYVISLRPLGQHAGLRRAAAAHGAKLLALSTLRIEPRIDAATRDALRAALAADAVVFTSPNAVHAALALQDLRAGGARAGRARAWLAVGAGTAAALRRAGIDLVQSPSRMDSDGLLALPALQGGHGRRIGLVTAPGGRDRIAPTLRERGIEVLRADVYARVPISPAPRTLARLRALQAPLLLALSSAEAFAALLDVVPGDVQATLRRARVLAASARLATLARGCGFGDVAIAASARPRDLLAAAVAHA